MKLTFASIALFLSFTIVSAEVSSISLSGFQLEFEGGNRLSSKEMILKSSACPSELIYKCDNPELEVSICSGDASRTYTRSFLKINNTGVADLSLSRIVLIDERMPNAAAVGEVSGSPVVVGKSFFGVEHPLADNRVEDEKVVCSLPVLHPLQPGESMQVSFVFGQASEPSQLRRSFAEYLNKERPRAYAPFLLHNTWYNLGYSNMFSEMQELELVETLGSELVEIRGAKIDAFVLDDGWDNTNTLWKFHEGWPEGLKNLTVNTKSWGAVPGIWISPWGGYNQPQKERLAAAASEGFETRNGAFSLAGPKYYQRFRALCVQAIHDGVGFFKFDGIGAKEGGHIDPASAEDFDAMLRLIEELRNLEPDLYLSQTVGTWPSPWWLFHVDNIWRGGADHDFSGVGSDRQQWITYRDAQVYHNVVVKAPLFPLNSLMTHGIILAEHAERLNTATLNDFRDEVRSYFGSGTQLQELYLSPELLTSEYWEILAQSAKWARDHADILKDVHWIGGDPTLLEPYGWAAWSAEKGIVVLRNPSDQPKQFSLDIGLAFDLPIGVCGRFSIESAYEDFRSPIESLSAGQPVTLDLNPFEILVLEAEAISDVN